MKRLVMVVVLVASVSNAADFGFSKSVSGLTAYTPVRRPLPYVEPEFGFGVEASGAAGVIDAFETRTVIAAAELSLNGRYRGALGAIEFWLRIAFLPKLNRFMDDFGGSAAFVWRSPNVVLGSFRLNAGVGLGAEFIRLCDPEFCAPYPGVRVELKPTLEYVAGDMLRPYVALNGSGFVALGSGAVLWSGALALGVHFNFAKPAPSTAGVASGSRGQ